MFHTGFFYVQSVFLCQAFKAATDTESDTPHLSGMAVVTLEGKALNFFLSLNVPSVP